MCVCWTGVYWSWNGGAKTVAYIDLTKKNGILTGAGGMFTYSFAHIKLNMYIFICILLIY